MRILFLIFLVFSGLQVQAQLSPAQDTFPWFVNYRLPTRVQGTKAPSSIFVMDSTQTKLRAVPVDSILSYIPRNQLLGYKEYMAYWTQADTNQPVLAFVVHDDIGDITFTRTGAGEYQVLQADSLFVVEKTSIDIGGDVATVTDSTTTVLDINISADQEAINIVEPNFNLDLNSWEGIVNTAYNEVNPGILIHIRVFN